MSNVIEVAAAVVLRDGRLMLATRPEGKHLAGFWEFPGGKVEPGESLEDCMARELLEELALNVIVRAQFFLIEHHYPEKTVRIHFMWCEWLEGSRAEALEGQNVQFVAPEELNLDQIVPADAIVFEALRNNDVAMMEEGDEIEPDKLYVTDSRYWLAFRNWYLSKGGDC